MNFNEMFRKNVTYGSFKSHKKSQGFTLSLENKKGGESNWPIPPAPIRYKVKQFCLKYLWNIKKNDFLEDLLQRLKLTVLNESLIDINIRFLEVSDCKIKPSHCAPIWLGIHNKLNIEILATLSSKLNLIQSDIVIAESNVGIGLVTYG